MTARLFGIILVWLVAMMPALAQDFQRAGADVRPLDPEAAFGMHLISVADGTAHIGWTIAPGYYLYRDSFAVHDSAGTDLPVDIPPGEVKQDPVFGKVAVFHDQAAIRVSGAQGTVKVTFQGCQEDGICYQPVTETLVLTGAGASGGAPDAPATPTPWDARIPAAADGEQPSDEAGAPAAIALAAQSGLGGLAEAGAGWVLLAYLGFGLALAFTPCVFPMLPILIAMLARQGEGLRPARGAVLSGAYVLAMASAFGAMGAAAGWSGQNLQIVLQSPWAIGTLAALFVLLALPGLTGMALSLPAALTTRLARIKGRRGSVGGAALLGLGAALIVGPCVTAPLAGALLYIAQTGNVALGAAALFALGLGQGIPLFLAGTFGAALLPKAGPWMARVRPFFALVFLAMAIWLLSRVLPAPAVLALWAMLLIGVAVHLGALDRAAHPLTRSLALVAMVAGLLQAMGAAMGAGDPLRPLAPLGTAARMVAPLRAEQEFVQVASPHQLRAVLADAADRPAMIYVTADWCTTCRGIERDVLPDPTIAAALSSMTRIKADVSDPDPAMRALMADLAVAGPPTMIFLDRVLREPPHSRLIGAVSPDDIARAAAAAGAG